MSEGSAQLILEEVRLLRLEMRQDIKDLHTKVDEVKIQTTKTNGRVTALEVKHTTCPIKEVESFITTQKTKDTKQYKIGELLITIGATAIVVISILTIGEKFL